MTDESAFPTAEQFAAEDEATGGDAPMIEQLQAELAEWKDKAMRAAAETENLRRRAEKERNDTRAYAIQKFAGDLVKAADNLERALSSAPRDPDNTALKNLVVGIEMTEKALQQAFEANGLKRVAPAKGEKFDPHSHQAMMEQEAADVDPGAVVHTLQPGYELFGRLVRPAMVAVAAKAREPIGPAYAPAGGPGTGEGFDRRT